MDVPERTYRCRPYRPLFTLLITAPMAIGAVIVGARRTDAWPMILAGFVFLVFDAWVLMAWINEQITVSEDGWTCRSWNGRERFVKFSEFEAVEANQEGLLDPAYVRLKDGSRVNIPASIQNYKLLERQAEVKVAANRGMRLLP